VKLEQRETSRVTSGRAIARDNRAVKTVRERGREGEGRREREGREDEELGAAARLRRYRVYRLDDVY